MGFSRSFAMTLRMFSLFSSANSGRTVYRTWTAFLVSPGCASLQRDVLTRVLPASR